MRGLTGLLAAGAVLFCCSMPALGEDAESQTTLAALISSFGEVAEKQAFADGSYSVTFHRQPIPGTASAVVTVVVALDSADECLCLTIETTARDRDTSPAGDYSEKVIKSVSCYPKDGEAGLEAYREAIKPSR